MLKYVKKEGTKSIFIDISAYKAHINSILMSKHTFVRFTNSIGAIPNLYLEPTSWNSTWLPWNFILFHCFNKSS